ncbi:MAG: CsiV family protein [Pseudohongiellaceae bacterium]
MNPLPALLFLFALTAVTGTVQGATAYDGNRWYQVEVSIFLNVSADDHNSEFWSARKLDLGFPPRLRPFNRISDFLMIDDFDARVLDYGLRSTGSDSELNVSTRSAADGINAIPAGPDPRRTTADIRLPDLQRHPYYLLPASEGDFQQTNRALETSPDHRLLFHGVWRQPILQEEQASPLYITGGQLLGGRHELEGSLTLRFNRNEDRVVIDANLWLSDFSTSRRSEELWTLPPLPSFATPEPAAENVRQPVYFINRIMHLQQSRDMRSDEFHYLDHPALGVVVEVNPYAPPPLELPEIPELRFPPLR